jgi:hypothetical protein
VVAMLARVPTYLNPGGVLYLPLSSLSDTGKILGAARRAFGHRIEQLSQISFPFCTELRQNMGLLNGLKEQGVIDFTTRGSRALWNLQIYRAWAP